jgi:hypothetical protein
MGVIVARERTFRGPAGRSNGTLTNTRLPLCASVSTSIALGRDCSWEGESTYLGWPPAA